MARADIARALGVALELTGTELSDGAAGAMVDDLARYPEAWVLRALGRCRRECRGRLTLADIVGRLDDGRPGPEAAWAACPRSEDDSAHWCEEHAQAYFAALPLLEQGDDVGARMAFLEHYRAAVAVARDAGHAPRWTLSPGRDPRHREAVIREAVEAGRIGAEHAQRLLPHVDGEAPAWLRQMLEAPVERMRLEDSR